MHALHAVRGVPACAVPWVVLDIVRNRARGEGQELVVVIVQRDADLLEVIGALAPPCRLSG
jgi:hypothetical protein